VRGLTAEAPVTFRGIRIGEVRRIMVREGTAGALDNGTDGAVPVLIHIEPGRLEMDDSGEGVRHLRAVMTQAVSAGLRGTLESGNLLTGSLYVNFDYFPNAEPAQIGEFDGVPLLPAISGGLARMQQQVAQLLVKLNNLPLNEAVTSANGTLASLQRTSEALEGLLASDQVRTLASTLTQTLARLDRTLEAYSRDSGLPDQLASAIAELESTLRSVESVAQRLERDPNAVFFPSEPSPDPQPRSGEP
jgi:paraquat-inducible protein B